VNALKLNYRAALAFAHDVLASAVCWVLAFWLRLNLEIPEEFLPALATAVTASVPLHALIFWLLGLYRGSWRYASLPDLKRIAFACLIGALAVPALLAFFRAGAAVPRSTFILAPLLLAAIMSGSRIGYRAWKEQALYGHVHLTAEPVLVIGAGDITVNLLREIERSSQVPVLGVIPEMRNKSAGPFYIVDNPRSIVSEAIRTLRTNLDFFTSTDSKKVIVISSTVSGEGKSFLAMNLGGILAMSKKRVILLDLDMRKAKDNGHAQVGNPSKGISTILIHRNTLQESIARTSLEGFDFIPSGPHPPNPSELLLNGEFEGLLNQLREQYDYIVIDTPPVGLVTDGIMAMKRADLSIYVVRANYSKKEFLKNLERIVAINKLSNVAVVLNALPSTGKTYGYGYYQEDKGKRNWAKQFFRS